MASTVHAPVSVTFTIILWATAALSFPFQNPFGLRSNHFSQSTLVNEIFSGLLREAGGRNGLHIYKAPGKSSLASCGRKNKFDRRGRDFFFSFGSRKDFNVGQLPIHFRKMIEYQSTKPYRQPEAAVTQSQH